MLMGPRIPRAIAVLSDSGPANVKGDGSSDRRDE